VISLQRRLDMVRPLLPEQEWTRIEQYVLTDAGLGTDVFGTQPQILALAYAMGYWLHRYYFRVVSTGHEHIPRSGPAVIAGNHSGVLPFDAVMMGTDVFANTEPPRLVRYMVDYFVFRLPFVGTLFRRLGQMPGTRRNFDGMMSEGHIVGVFPEGATALGKPAAERYVLSEFNPGHVELAARHGAPVIPFGLVGAEEQQTMIADIKPLARALRLPYFPITTTFPLLGPFGLLPRPSRYFIRYGEPIEVDPAVLRSVEARAREVERVRESVAEQIRLGQQTRRDHREGRA
jgi:1-acyl-sn-glycerol-3-phosphate acyltransferase